MKGVPIGDKTEEESGQLTVDDASAAYGVDLIKGKLKPVYKQTEVGVIPEEWEVSFIGDKASKVGSGITPTGGEKIYKPEGRPFLRSQNVGWGQLFLGDIAFIDEATHDTFKSTEIEVRDVFLNITGASIGRSAVADDRVKSGNVNQHVCIIRTIKSQLDPYLLNYFLLSKGGQRQIDSFQAGGNRQGLNFGQIRSIQIPVPTISEQQTIVAALSDVDVLLAKLDQLIAKKRDLKLATMQQLLTGQTRLSGFCQIGSCFKQTEVGCIPAEWEIKTVKEITLDHKQGYYTKDKYIENGVRLVRITDLMNPRIDYLTMPMLRISKSDLDLYKIRNGDFLFARSGAIGRFGIVYEDIEAVFGSYIIRFTFDSEKLNNEYFGFLYQTEIIWKQLIAITQGSSNININAANIKNLKIPLPHLEEQTAIATILSDMDAEIAALEARRDKTRDIKLGMMQELLTGRIRLV